MLHTTLYLLIVYKGIRGKHNANFSDYGENG